MQHCQLKCKLPKKPQDLKGKKVGERSGIVDIRQQKRKTGYQKGSEKRMKASLATVLSELSQDV